MSRGRLIVGSDESRMGDSEPSQKVFSICPLSVVLCESLNSVRTYVRRVCEWGHRDPAIDGLCGVSTRFDPEDQTKFGNWSPFNVASVSEPRIKGRRGSLAVAFGG